MLAALAAVFFTLLFLSDLSWYICLIVSLVVAPICGVVELVSKRGSDTLTIPLAAAAAAFPLVILLSYLGW